MSVQLNNMIYLAFSKVAEAVFPIAPNPTPTASPSVKKRMKSILGRLTFNSATEFGVQFCLIVKLNPPY